jgi:hypothetical protein
VLDLGYKIARGKNISFFRASHFAQNRFLKKTGILFFVAN